MTLPSFALQGTKKYDFCLINGNEDFAIIPAKTIKSINIDTAIRLQFGDRNFGATHIAVKHTNWINLLIRKHIIHDIENSVANLLWLKLGQAGSIYSTESKNKIKIIMAVAPDALLVLKHIENENFFTVVTLYNKSNGSIDGVQIGRYKPQFRC